MANELLLLFAVASGVLLATAVGTSILFVRARARAVAAERALRASEERYRAMVETTDAMKSDFVSFVSHQLRTPLCGVSWILELAAETPSLSPDVASYVNDARESAHRLIRLVNDLLDVSRLESGRVDVNPQRLRLYDVVSTVATDLKHLVEDRRLQLTIHAPDPNAMVYVDPRLMRQAVTNLLSNAAKYTPSGGRIDITLTQGERTVSCAVRDTGIGVPRDAQPRLFEKFFRADNAVVMESEGTGLGLRLVHLVVDRFGGRVWCESELGRGSIFTMELPYN